MTTDVQKLERVGDVTLDALRDLTRHLAQLNDDALHDSTLDTQKKGRERGEKRKEEKGERKEGKRGERKEEAEARRSIGCFLFFISV